MTQWYNKEMGLNFSPDRNHAHIEVWASGNDLLGYVVAQTKEAAENAALALLKPVF
jgi:hypothetical protein